MEEKILHFLKEELEMSEQEVNRCLLYNPPQASYARGYHNAIAVIMEYLTKEVIK